MSDPIPVNRRLVAVFAADVEGYSRLMGTDEVGTLQGLAERRAILDKLIGDHRGRIANTAGDSVLAEFGSAVEAVEAQTALAEANSSLAGAATRVHSSQKGRGSGHAGLSRKAALGAHSCASSSTAGTTSTGKKKILVLAEKLVHNAIENDESWAFSMIYDRLEGKAVQPIEVSDADTIPANAIASLVDQHGRMKLEALKPPRLTNQIRAYLADVADGR